MAIAAHRLAPAADLESPVIFSRIFGAPLKAAGKGGPLAHPSARSQKVTGTPPRHSIAPRRASTRRSFAPRYPTSGKSPATREGPVKSPVRARFPRFAVGKGSGHRNLTVNRPSYAIFVLAAGSCRAKTGEIPLSSNFAPVTSLWSHTSTGDFTEKNSQKPVSFRH